MGATKDYIPNKDSEFFNWQENLVSMTVSHAVAWGIAPAAVTELQSRQAQYEPLYKAIAVKNNRTQMQVAEHREGRTTYQKYLRGFARQWLAFNPAISASVKASTGLRVRKESRSQRPAIADTPSVLLHGLPGKWVRVICRMTHDSNRPSLHPHADAVELRYSIGQKPENYTQAPYTHFSTRASFIMEMEQTMGGQTMYVFVRWCNLKQKEKSGPFSERVQVIIG